MKPEDSGEYKVTVTNSKGSTDVTTSVTVTDPVTTPDAIFDFIQKLENLSIKDGKLKILLVQYHIYTIPIPHHFHANTTLILHLVHTDIVIRYA